MALSNGFHSSSPARQDHADKESPWRKATDSPSRQLLRELGLQTDANTRAFHARLDEQTLHLEREHRLALAAATLEHERIRESAERTHQRMQIQMEWERHAQEEEEKQALERERQGLLEREIAGRRREVEEAERLKRLKQAAVEAQARADRAREEAAKIPEPVPVPTPKAESPQPRAQVLNGVAMKPPASLSSTNGTTNPNNQTQDPISAAQNVSNPIKSSEISIQQQEQSPTPRTTASQAQISGLAKSKHHQYLEVHQRLKELRRTVGELKDQQLKKLTGEFRREIKKSVGQLTIEMKANTAPYNKIRDTLNQSASLQQPQIDIRSYLVTNLPPNAASLPGTAGLIHIYLLNIFSKAVVSQFVNEAGVAPKAAEPIGTVAIRIFAAPEFKWQGVSLIDILVAKLHAVCPILFGVYGRSPATKTQKRGESLSGLGSGFAALSLRDFGKSTMQNPFPPINYWQALTCIVNTPPKETTPEHFIVLKAMIENHTDKFIKFFGQNAIVALRKAVVEFPQQTSKTVASSALSTLQVTLQRDMHLTL